MQEKGLEFEIKILTFGLSQKNISNFNFIP